MRIIVDKRIPEWFTKVLECSTILRWGIVVVPASTTLEIAELTLQPKEHTIPRTAYHYTDIADEIETTIINYLTNHEGVIHLQGIENFTNDLLRMKYYCQEVNAVLEGVLTPPNTINGNLYSIPLISDEAIKTNTLVGGMWSDGILCLADTLVMTDTELTFAFDFAVRHPSAFVIAEKVGL